MMKLAYGISGYVVLVLVLSVTTCSDPPGTVEISYQEKIQEDIFDIYCLTACHDGAALGNLELTSYETLMQGGDIAIVLPWNSEESPLYWSLNGLDNTGNRVDLMPPTGRPQPTRNQILDVRDWIDQGAQNN